MASKHLAVFFLTYALVSAFVCIAMTPEDTVIDTTTAYMEQNRAVLGSFVENLLSQNENVLKNLLGMFPKLNGNGTSSFDLQQMNVMDILSGLTKIMGTSRPQGYANLLDSLISSNPTVFQMLSTMFNANNGTGVGSMVGGILPLLQSLGENSPSTVRFGSFATPLLINYATTALRGTNVSDKCVNETTGVIQAVMDGELWAWAFIDAMGKPLSGIMEGGLQWLGSFHQCVNIRPTTQNENSRVIDGNYCLLTIPLPTSLVSMLAGEGQKAGKLASLQYGVCVPDSCSAEDLAKITNGGLIKELGSLYGQDVPSVKSYCHRDYKIGEDTTAIAVMGIFCGIGLLILVGTLYDIANQSYAHLQKSPDVAGAFSKLTNEHDSTVIHHDKPNACNKVPSATSKIDSDERLESLPNVDVYVVKTTTSETETERRSGLPAQVQPELNVNRPKTRPTSKMSAAREILDGPLKSFSLFTNMAKLLNTDTTAENLGSINGVRFLSMSWVILGHSISDTKLKTNLGAFGPVFQSRWTARVVLNGVLSVDSFFTLSGILLTYLTLKEMGKRKSAKINWFMFYFHRIWRLTPTYMLIFMVYVPLFKYWGNGPVWGPTPLTPEGCISNWWKNMLYINNFDMEHTCMPWTWYLAIDMQFYIISPLLLIPLFYSKIVGLVVLGMVLFAHVTTTGVLSAVYEIPSQGNGRDFGDLIYDVPWSRIGPYLAGILVGYVLYKTNRKIKLHKSTVILGWTVAAVCCLATVYGMDGLFGSTGSKPLSVGALAAYQALSRTAWGLGLGWVIFACCTGYGGPVNTFLSWKCFTPLARLTFCAYLVHPVVIAYVGQSAKLPQYLSYVTLSYAFVGHMVFSYAIAFLASLVFEAPMVGLEKVLLKRK